MNGRGGQCADGVTEAVNHPIQRCKYLVTETHLAKFFPDLLNRIHFRCVWRDKKEFYVRWYAERAAFVPCSSVTAQENDIIRILP